MTIFNLETDLKSSNVSERLATGGNATFQVAPDLLGDFTYDLEDIIVIKAESRAIFKGVIQETGHTLTTEDVQAQATAVDQYVDSQLWDAVNVYYNTPEIVCGTSFDNATIQDFIDIEHVGSVLTWFPSIIAEGTVGELPLPQITTLSKGFMTVIQEILAPYPYVKWLIEFSDDDSAVFPVGTLILFDTRVGRTAHLLNVGVDEKQIVDMNIQRTATETAKYVEIHARGKFVERFELLTPDWNSSDERVYYQNIANPIRIPAPKSSDGSIQLPEGYGDFTYDLWIFANEVQAVTPPGVGVISNQIRLWPGADFELNMETGEIRFLKPKEGDQWWWVNRETGVVTTQYKNLLGSFPGLEVAQLRRPVAYNDAHIGSDVNYVFYVFRMLREPYRKYKTQYPIADFRIESYIDQDESGQDITRYRKLPTSFDIFIPKALTEGRYEIEARVDASQYFDGTNDAGLSGDFYAEPGADNREAWANMYSQVNNIVKSINERNDPSLLEPMPIPDGLAQMLWPNVTFDTVEDLTLDQLNSYFAQSGGSVTFEEGTKCVLLAERQLMANPLWYDIPKEHANIGTNTTADPIRADWFTWPVLARYTSWEELVEYRTTSFGGERYYRGVVNSVFRYEDWTQLDEEGNTLVVFDNTVVPDPAPVTPFRILSDIADDAADYFGSPYWTGTITLPLTYIHATGNYDMPYSVGDLITLDGDVSPSLKFDGVTPFEGLINQITYNLDTLTVTLGFGRREPKTNPFLSRADYPVDIEGDSLTGEGKAGLSPLGGSQ